jgi:hypothetical protein
MIDEVIIHCTDQSSALCGIEEQAAFRIRFAMAGIALPILDFKYDSLTYPEVASVASKVEFIL